MASSTLSARSLSAFRRRACATGARTLLADGPDPLDATIAEVLVSTPAQSIAGGTDEIQRNIIGEKILGLPREPATDLDRPFRDVIRGSD